MDLSLELLLLLMTVAFAAGLIDAIAGGGGLLTLPALLAAGLPPVAAIATNKLQGTLGTGGAFLAFARAGRIDFRRFRWPALAVFLGSAGGALAVQAVDTAVLRALVPVLLIAVAFYFLLGPRLGEEDRRQRVGAAGLLALLALIGAYDGFFGPGTGSFLTVCLVALGGLGLLRAIAHTRFLNFSSNLAGLLVLMAGGHVLWETGLAMAAASVLGGQLGARLALRHGGRLVRPLLVLVSLALSLRLLLDPANPLAGLLAGVLTGPR